MSEIKLKGKVIKILPIESGESSKGSWSKQGMIVETIGEYPKQIYYEGWNAICDTISGLTIGQNVTVYFNPASREYKDRWYTDLKVWKIEKN